MRVTVNSLDPSSFLKAAKKVRAYENRVASNNREFLKDLALEGIMEASARLGDEYVAPDYVKPQLSTLNPHVMNGKSKGDMSITLRLQGKQAVFVEFGAGIFYNGGKGMIGDSPHPYGVELGFTIGDYGLHLGRNETWSYGGHVTHGTPAAMPLYHAGVKIKQNARILALAHFRSY